MRQPTLCPSYLHYRLTHYISWLPLCHHSRLLKTQVRSPPDGSNTRQGLYIAFPRVSRVNSAIQGTVALSPSRSHIACTLATHRSEMCAHACANLLTLQKEGRKTPQHKFTRKGVSRNVSTFGDIYDLPTRTLRKSTFIIN